MNALGTWFRFWFVLFFSLGIGGRSLAGNFPLKVSTSNPHLLVDQLDTPYLIHGDAAWGLTVMLNQSAADQYLANRAAKGFNTVMVMLIVYDKDINNHASVNAYGQEPFTTSNDFTKPNEAYFVNADWVIDRAAQLGIQVLLAPCYVGYNAEEGWQDVMVANGTNGCRAYGRFLGQRYQNRPNLIWLHSGDNGDPTYMPYIRAMALGIKEHDTNHLHTVKLWPEQSSRDVYGGESWLDLNATYVYGTLPQWGWDLRVPEKSLADFNATPVLPSFLCEANYENEHGGTAHWVRRQAYWSVLCGSTGQLMGNGAIWPFLTGWQTQMDNTASVDMTRLKKLFATRPWFTMVPDQYHTTVTSGYGALASDEYVTAMRATNGSTVIAYLPVGRTLGVDMSKVSGAQANAWWFNPRTGTSTNIGTFATSGTRNFTPADTNDWILVLDDSTAGYIAPGSGPDQLEILTGSAPAGRAGVFYCTELFAHGGAPPYVWSVATNSLLPPGLTFSTSGILSGTASNSGVFSLVVQVADTNLTTTTQTLLLTFHERDDIPPTTPATLTAFGASCRQIDLTWDVSTDNVATTAYSIERRGGTNVCFTPITTTVLPSFRDSGLTPGTAYQYRVQAADASGNRSPYSSVASATTFLAPTVPPDLIAGYGFNEGVGMQTRDAADNGNVGNITGATWTTSGKFGSALTFNGSNNLVLVSYAPTLNLTTGMTLEAWVYPTTSQNGWRTIVQREADAYLLHAGNDKSALRPTGGGTFNGAIAWTNATTALTLNTWTHLALTYDSTALRLYVNGTQSASKAVSSPIQTNTNPLRIGGNSPYGEYFLGRIDEVRVYRRCLSPAEIQTDMNTPVEAAATNTAPSISCLTDQVASENAVIGPLDFTVTDAECTTDNLILLGHSSNPTLVPACNIEFTGSGTNRAVTIIPAPGQTGTATIMLSVSDGQFTGSSYFDITVNAITNPPAPIVITSVALTESNHFRLIGTGDANTTYTIQSSTDLLEWLDAGDTITDESGAFAFEDEEAAVHDARFYRVILRL